MNFLSDIVSVKNEEVMKLRSKFQKSEWEQRISEMRPAVPFLQIAQKSRGMSVIAEIKRASPSKGAIQASADPESIALLYDEAGVDALSVLTDERFFRGSIHDLVSVRTVTQRPILRKDFIIDAWQIYEARAIGADVILLIAAILTDEQLHSLYSLAKELGMSVLLEVHQKDELTRLLKLDRPEFIGINNRDLRTFHVDLATTENLAPIAKDLFPDAFLISESGISSREDVERVERVGVRGILVGETLMRAQGPQVKETIYALKGISHIEANG